MFSQRHPARIVGSPCRTSPLTTAIRNAATCPDTDADAEGYVAFPRVDPAEEMVDLMSASRGYQANVAAISAVKDMIARSIDLFR